MDKVFFTFTFAVLVSLLHGKSIDRFRQPGTNVLTILPVVNSTPGNTNNFTSLGGMCFQPECPKDNQGSTTTLQPTGGRDKSESSCVGRCGSYDNALCSCDNSCGFKGICCDDYFDACISSGGLPSRGDHLDHDYLKLVATCDQYKQVKLISVCPLTATAEEKELCESEDVDQMPNAVLPMESTSRVKGTASFKNIFCYRCWHLDGFPLPWEINIITTHHNPLSDYYNWTSQLGFIQQNPTFVSWIRPGALPLQQCDEENLWQTCVFCAEGLNNVPRECSLTHESKTSSGDDRQCYQCMNDKFTKQMGLKCNYIGDLSSETITTHLSISQNKGDESIYTVERDDEPDDIMSYPWMSLSCSTLDNICTATRCSSNSYKVNGRCDFYKYFRIIIKLCLVDQFRYPLNCTKEDNIMDIFPILDKYEGTHQNHMDQNVSVFQANLKNKTPLKSFNQTGTRKSSLTSDEIETNGFKEKVQNSYPAFTQFLFETVLESTEVFAVTKSYVMLNDVKILKQGDSGTFVAIINGKLKNEVDVDWERAEWYVREKIPLYLRKIGVMGKIIQCVQFDLGQPMAAPRINHTEFCNPVNIYSPQGPPSPFHSAATSPPLGITIEVLIFMLTWVSRA